MEREHDPLPEAKEVIRTRCPKPGTRWQHKRTGKIVVIQMAVLIEVGVLPGVAYTEQGDPDTPPWVRSIQVFLDRFEPYLGRHDRATKADEWGHLPNEPCRYCRKPGGVYFLQDNGPEGRDGLQPMRCENCKRDWIAGTSTA
jgi:hypothetical protein